MCRHPYKHKQVGHWARTLIIGNKPCLFSHRMTVNVAILIYKGGDTYDEVKILHLLWTWCPQKSYRCNHRNHKCRWNLWVYVSAPQNISYFSLFLLDAVVEIVVVRCQVGATDMLFLIIKQLPKCPSVILDWLQLDAGLFRLVFVYQIILIDTVAKTLIFRTIFPCLIRLYIARSRRETVVSLCCPSIIWYSSLSLTGLKVETMLPKKWFFWLFLTTLIRSS